MKGKAKPTALLWYVQQRISKIQLPFFHLFYPEPSIPKSPFPNTEFLRRTYSKTVQLIHLPIIELLLAEFLYSHPLYKPISKKKHNVMSYCILHGNQNLHLLSGKMEKSPYISSSTAISPNCPSLLPSFPPSLLPSFPPSLLPSFPPSLLPSFPPSLLPSFPPSLLPSFPPSLLPSFPPSLLPLHPPSHLRPQNPNPKF